MTTADELEAIKRRDAAWTASAMGPSNASQAARDRRFLLLDRKRLLRLVQIGSQLSNIAFNLAQEQSLSDRTRRCCDETRREWDAALRESSEEVRRG